MDKTSRNEKKKIDTKFIHEKSSPFDWKWFSQMINSINVCFISLGSYPLFDIHCNRTFGGAEVQMYLLAKELSKDQRFGVSFIVGNFGQEKVEYYDKIRWSI